MKLPPSTIWLALGLLLLLALQQLVAWPGHGRVPSGIHDGLHGVWFAVVTFLGHALVCRRWQTHRVARTVAIVVALALATELLQLATAREAGWGDVALDLVGALAALLVIGARSGRLARVPALTLASFLLVATSTPAIVAVAVQWHRDAIFPLLVDPSAFRFGGLLRSNSEVRRAAGEPGWPGVEGDVIELVLADDRWPGFYLPEPVSDWRAFDALVVDVFVPDGEPLVLHVSIRLRGADHVYRTFRLPAGPSQVRMELRELFDPTAVEVGMVVVYSSQAFAGRRLKIARVGLERGARLGAR